MRFNETSEGTIKITTDDLDLAYLEPQNKDNCGRSTNIEGVYLYPIEFLEGALKEPVEGTFSQMAYDQIRSLSDEEIVNFFSQWEEAMHPNNTQMEIFKNLIKEVRK